MKSFMSICLNKNGKVPIYKQLGEALLELISDGVLEPDSKLPPVRKMAESLKINSSTVVNAYKYLETKHAVYSFMGSGTFVAPASRNVPEAVLLDRPVMEMVMETAVRADFTSDMLPESLFPRDEMKRAFNTVIEREGGNTFAGIGTRCLDLFVEDVVSILGENGIAADKRSIFITPSLGSAVELVSKSVVKKGDYVIIEKPSAYPRLGVYVERGAKVLQAPVGPGGIEVNFFESLLKMYRPKAAHLSAYFQNPTNACYSLQSKKAILELCYKYGTAIIEEDVYSGLISDNKKIFFKSLDYRGEVVYVKNMTKISLPWLNVNISVIPRKHRQNVEKASLHMNAAITPLQILLLHELLFSEAYANYNKKIVKNNQSAYENYAEIINRILGEFVEYDKEVTGAGFWLEIKSGSSIALARNCAKKGVLITPGGIYSGGDDNHFRICTRGVSNDEFIYGICVLKDELTKLRLQ